MHHFRLATFIVSFLFCIKVKNVYAQCVTEADPCTATLDDVGAGCAVDGAAGRCVPNPDATYLYCSIAGMVVADDVSNLALILEELAGRSGRTT
ncbi:unnamed protein product, partial [Ectocarpus sp. 12 AP-2014]